MKPHFQRAARGRKPVYKDHGYHAGCVVIIGALIGLFSIVLIAYLNITEPSIKERHNEWHKTQ